MKPKRWTWYSGILPVLLALGGAYAAWTLFKGLRFERLGQPLALSALGLLLPLAGLLGYSIRRQHKRLRALIDHPLLGRMATAVPGSRLLTQGLLWLAALACLGMALARPQGPPAMSQLEASGIDLLCALDISDSTKATDEFPNRLGAAKRAIAELLPQLPGDRLGLMVFSGEAYPIAPFTSDYGALEGILDEIDHGLLPTATTNLGAMLKMAKERFRQNQEESGRALLIFSDGENQQGDFQQDLKALTDMGVKVFTIGLGSHQGSRIPEINQVWGTQSYKTWQGEEVVTRIDEEALKALAQAGQGRYLHIDKLRELPGVLNEARSHMQTRRSNSSGAIVYEERYQPWLLLALLLLGLERGLALRPQRPARQPLFARILRRVQGLQPRLGVALVLLPLLNSAWHWPWEGYWKDFQGRRDYQQQKYDRADKDYQKGLEAAPGSPELLYNQGNTRYRGGKYDQAAENYRKSLEARNATPEAKAQAWYNLGNSFYRQGQQNQQADKQTEQTWKKSIESYQQALKLNPRDTQALENLNFVQEKLQQLQQQQGNQGNQGNQNQKNQQNQQNQQNQKNQQNQQNQQGNQGNQGNQNPQGGKAPTSPLDNRFTDQQIQSYLDELERREQESRDQFQRIPNPNPSPDPLRDPFNEGEGKDPSVKDW
ncbi:MAG: VWA domain-containing protein [Candidatus Sericytochromatia bacterium]